MVSKTKVRILEPCVEDKRTGFFRSTVNVVNETEACERELERSLTKAEQKLIEEKHFGPTRRKKYAGVCPVCEHESEFMDVPNKWGPFLIQGFKNTVLVMMSPRTSIKRMLSAQKNAFPCFCSQCDEAILVCPLCFATSGRFPLDPEEKVQCPHCNAVI